MDDKLKELIASLIGAINNCAEEPGQIADAVSEINKIGYGVLVAFQIIAVPFGAEANLGGNESKSVSEQKDAPEPQTEPPKIKVTTGNHRFLKALKIKDPGSTL